MCGVLSEVPLPLWGAGARGSEQASRTHRGLWPEVGCMSLEHHGDVPACTPHAWQIQAWPELCLLLGPLFSSPTQTRECPASPLSLTGRNTVPRFPECSPSSELSTLLLQSRGPPYLPAVWCPRAANRWQVGAALRVLDQTSLRDRRMSLTLVLDRGMLHRFSLCWSWDGSPPTGDSGAGWAQQGLSPSSPQLWRGRGTPPPGWCGRASFSLPMPSSRPKPGGLCSPPWRPPSHFLLISRGVRSPS